MLPNNGKRGGFTIVELLIVVVVIAILAAIAIVSYNGIQKRAKEAAITADLKSVSQQLIASQATDGTGQYPDTLTGANDGKGVTTSKNIKYQYTAVNSATSATFCVTASYGDIDYKITESTTALAGVCAGHTAGGPSPAVITNLSTNPSFEVDTSGWTDSHGVTSQQAGAAKVGSYGMRFTVDDIGFFPRAGSAYVPATAGKVYTLSAWLRSSAPVRISYALNGGSTTASAAIVSDNQWVRASITTVITPANTTSLKAWVGLADDSALNTTLDVDGVMITEGTSTPAFADGTTSGWSWSGTPHNSTSTGQTP